MFDNPFSSFHHIVAEAKEEREQLDRLLTISTPRERLLVAVIALVLSALAAWLFFGSVARSVAVDGVLVEPGEHLFGGNGSVQALVWVRSGVAPQIEAGMPAVMELAGTEEDTGALAGKVAAIAAAPLSDGLEAFELAGPASVHRIDISLDEAFESASLAGRECRIVIQLGRQSPFELFGMRRY